MPTFSHLHVHTEYSLLDGLSSIDSLYAKAKQDNMPAIAISDHGNMFGVFDFVNKAWKDTVIIGKDDQGKDILTPKIKPIVGCEFYVVEDRHKKTFSRENKDERYHQIMLAKNSLGYKHLSQLCSLGYIEGMYSKYPRIDKKLIEKYHEGLIATTCCIGGYVPQAILQKGEDAAEAEFQWWLNIFEKDYYIELQRHQLHEQEKVNDILLKWAKKYNVPVIATNDSHYTQETDYLTHDVLLCINTNAKLNTPGYDDMINDDIQVKNRRFKFNNNQYYLKTTKEMELLFADIPEAIDNTQAIVDKIEPLQLKKDILLPNFPIPPAFQIHTDYQLNQWEYLKHLTLEGAKRKYTEITTDIQERIDFELFTIKTMGFAGYFLIVSDFIKEGKRMGVWIGPGRGSAVGSVVAYCLDITNIEPMKYNLLFERFLNPDRKSMPDIDTDFDVEGRSKVIDYVVQKYGKENVAAIVTYGTMAAKSSIKDVARAYDIPLTDSNQLTGLISGSIKNDVHLKDIFHAPLYKKDGDNSLESKDVQVNILENVKKIRTIYNDTDHIHATVLQHAEKLEGTIRQVGIHAAGVIIAPTSLLDIMPVCISKESPLWVTQIEGRVIEEAGVIKMDFLGLKTLSVMKMTVEFIRLTHGIDIDVDTIPLDDIASFQLFQKGDTVAVFQFESTGMRKYLIELKPDKIDDLIAINALYRPGPMQYVNNFINRKKGKEKIEYDLPEMEQYLKETYGVTVYQEQVMLLAQKIADFSKGEADMLRKAMGKKDKKILEKMKVRFMDNASKKYPQPILEKIWLDWESFAEYAFNKAHATCYAILAYKIAYLKSHYPICFMAASLNYSSSDELPSFLDECKRLKIDIVRPDINESTKHFTPTKDKKIRFGFTGIKGVGEAAIETIIEERIKKGLFTDIRDFLSRVKISSTAIEALVYTGAFDCFPLLHRAQYFFVPPGAKISNIAKIINIISTKSKQKDSNLVTLFDGTDIDINNTDDNTTDTAKLPPLPNCPKLSILEQIEKEKEYAGMYISGHPLDPYAFDLSHYKFFPLRDIPILQERLLQNKDGNAIPTFLGGLITKVDIRKTKNGNEFVSFILEDLSGNTNILLWTEEYLKVKPFLQVGNVVCIKTFIQRQYESDKFNYKVSFINLLENFREEHIHSIELQIPLTEINETMIHLFKTYIEQSPGKTNLKIHLQDENNQHSLLSQKKIKINSMLIDLLNQYKNIKINITA